MRRSVCFISETGQRNRPIADPSVRYRCYHPAEILMRQGIDCSIYAAATFFEKPYYDADLYIFHRPSVGRQGFGRTIEILQSLGRKVIADYDDLIFGDADIALSSSAVKNATMTAEKAISAFAANLEAMRLFSEITVSTKPLGDRAAEYNPTASVTVIPNLIPESTLLPHREYGTAFRKRPRGAIGYFAGTKSHNHDFPLVEDVLHRVLSENQDFRLLVVGPVALPKAIASLPNVVSGPPTSYWRLPFAMTYCDTVIAPLETSEFNVCKSRVKYLEAALAGCRLVATPIPDMQAVGADRMVLAESKDDWYTALSQPEEQEQAELRAARNLSYLNSYEQIDTLKKIGGLQ